MPFCGSCGKEISATARFCPYCGVPVEAETFLIPPPVPSTSPKINERKHNASFMSLGGRREFLLKEKLLSFRGKVEIKDPATQQPIGFFESKILSIRALYRLYNLQNVIELIVQQKLMSLRSEFKFYKGSPSGEPDESNISVC